MVIIINHTNFHARAMKEPNFETGTLGYNFSYPVLNTIEIGNLFITGGETTINIERKGEIIWAFDKEKSQLHIKKPNSEEIHTIDNPSELYQKMSQHFNENYEHLMNQNLAVCKKKSQSLKGNQNAIKDNQEDKVENKPKHPGFNIRKKEKPKDFFPLSEYNGDKKDYLRFAKERGWAPFLPFNEQCDGVEMGFFKEEDLSEYY